MFKINFKRTVAFVLCISLLFGCFTVDTFAYEPVVFIENLTLDYTMSSGPSVRTTVTYSDEALINSINNQLKNFKTNISISEFKVPYNDAGINKIVNILSGELPECFHLESSFSISYSSLGYITAINPTYSFSKAEYDSMLAECEVAADEMLADIENNNNLTDVQKLLLLHDRIAISCEYDYENYLKGSIPRISHTMYGVFANKVAVCQGYALAYAYLLDKIGIENRYCSSRALNHAWNIVNVNGKDYHIDITWDDPTFDITGRVLHKNFLVSTNKLIENEHTATDFDSSPTDTTYDNYFWQNAETSFVQLNDEIYYIDGKSTQNITIKRYSDNATLYQAQHYWMASASAYYPGNYARLSLSGSKLLFSLSDAIYSFNPKNNEVKRIHSKPNINGYFNIYGFTYADGMLVYDLYSSPNFDSNTKKNYQFKVPYHDAGNINNDGEINLEDVVALSRALAGWQVECDESIFDVNGDGAKNLLDLIRLAQYVAEWEGIELY